ncbi:PREDICTED: uncharacterized protein LOC108563387 [Nicrophorus vespilloides]|uniref:Uncharacterized protein LOC108563387 n=1 Tax=Nicrophorus vespilloides TaxID=110193 RepID=A0ABM1MSI7_NICVS|nr:PREDICTED: uncharacterized protein LOC108563387 [Nicrophorus vespilloides]
MSRTWTLCFKSPLITQQSDHHTFFNKFNSYGKSQRLYLNYNNQTGYVIYETKSTADLAKEDLSKINELLITIESLVPNEMDFTYNIANSMYDIYGNEVPCISLEDGERYIPLSKMESLGFQFFDNPCTGKDDDENMLIALMEYLKVQLQIFMRVQGNIMNIDKVNWLMNHFFSSIKEQRINQREVFSNSRQSKVVDVPKRNFAVQKEQQNQTGQEMFRHLRPNNNVEPLKKNLTNYQTKADRGPKKVVENGKSPNSYTVKKNKTAEECSPSNITKTLMGLKIVIDNMHQVSCRRSIADSLANTSGIVTVTKIIDPTIFIATVFPSTCSDDVLTLEEISPDIKSCGIINYKPKVGEIVAVQNDSSFWVRGFVIEITVDEKLKVGLVDYGTVIVTDRACALPARFRTIPEYAVKCKSTKQIVEKLKVDSDIEYHSTENNKFSFNKTYEVTCSQWNPLEDIKVKSQAVILEMPPRSKNLQINELAILINVKQDGTLYLRTLVHSKNIRTLQNTINETKLLKLESAPVLNQLVIHKLKDHYSRAVVTDIINSNKVVLRYIDYEIVGEVDVDSLFYIDKFADQEIPLIQAKLKGFEKKGFSEKATDFMNTLKADMTKLVIENYNKSAELVELSTENQSLNLLIEKVEKPGYPRFQDLQMRKLTIGEQYKMLLIEMEYIEKTTCHCMLSDENVQAEFLTICKIIEKNKNPTHPLNLHVDELCIAKYEQEWFRGQVLDIESDGRACTIYFIDFGNVSRVDFENIRNIPEELLEFSPMAMKTVFSGQKPTVIYQVHEVIVREINTSSNTYFVDLLE